MTHPLTVARDLKASCSGKALYPTKAAAIKVLRRLKNVETKRPEPYRCRHCDGFHLGRGR